MYGNKISSGIDWVDFLEGIFKRVKQIFEEAYPVRDEEAVSPNLAALREAVYSLPCAIKILEIEINAQKYEHIKDNVCQIIRYDFSKLGKVSVEYLGIITADEVEKLQDILFEKLGFEQEDATDFAKHLCEDLKTTGCFDPSKPDFYLHFTFFNIRKNPEKYARELFFLLTLPGMLPFVDKFRKEMEPDWNALYDLKQDPILQLPKIIQRDPILDGFLGFSTVEDVQEAICDIQLIPAVPEEVKRVFNLAKDLFVYGYFKYRFFTVSQHYAFLALESAVRHKYIESLGQKAILTDKRRDLYYEMSSPSYQKIWEFCSRNKRIGWSAYRLLVNDEPFPYKTRKILDWMVAKKILKKWERELYDAGIFLRNSLSHVERPSIMTPDSQILRKIVEDINKLFHEENANVSKQHTKRIQS